MEKMMPLSAASSVFGNVGRPLSTRTWATVVGNGRKIGRDVKFVFAVHYVPGHWCFILADFEKQLITYYDSLCGAVYATAACRVFKTWLASECVRQNSGDYRPAGWRVAVDHAPKQPAGVSCGVCVLLMPKLLADDPARFYDALSRQETWSPQQILRARAQYACELLHRPNGTNDAEAAYLANERGLAQEQQIIEVEDDINQG